MKNNKMILAVLLVLQLGFVVCFVGVALQNTSAQFTLQTDAGAASVTDEETGGQIFSVVRLFPHCRKIRQTKLYSARRK